MIAYHAGPITPNSIAYYLWHTHHAQVSFAEREQAIIAAARSPSFTLEIPASIVGERDRRLEYQDWVREWRTHPGFDFALIPFIPGAATDTNDYLLAEWQLGEAGVPVWSLGESTDRLKHLTRTWPRVAIYTDGDDQPARTRPWWDRLEQAMTAICDEAGRPPCRLHGYRLLNPSVHRHLPLASADTDLVARAIHHPQRWCGPLAPMTNATRAAVLAERLEAHNAPGAWAGLRSGVDDWPLDWLADEDAHAEPGTPTSPERASGPDTEARAELESTNESDQGSADATTIRRLA